VEIIGPTLKTLWLNDAVNPADGIAFPFMASFSRALQVDGKRRIYGNGRKRATTTATKTNDWQASLPHCDRVQIAWLEAHAGKTVIARDDRGNRIFAIYWSTGVDESAYNTDGTVNLTLEELTYSLAV
jgi:hypothetical protein